MKSSFLDGEIQVLQTKKFSKPLVRLQHQLSEIKRSTCRLAYRTSYLPYGPWASDGSVTHGELIIRHCDFFIFIHIYADVCNISSSFFGLIWFHHIYVGLTMKNGALNPFHTWFGLLPSAPPQGGPKQWDFLSTEPHLRRHGNGRWAPCRPRVVGVRPKLGIA